MRDRSAPETRWTLQVPRPWVVEDASLAVPNQSRELRDASQSGPGPAPAETRYAPATRETAAARAADQIACMPVTALPARRLRRPHRCATLRAPREKRAA